MTTILTEIRTGAYYDSVVLMQLQRSLADLPGVVDAGVVMGTPANKELLTQSDLLSAEAQNASNDDLILVVKGEGAEAVKAALAQVDELLARRRSQTASEGYRPKSLASAAKMLPDARWVLVSVPGRFAAGVAEEALDLGKNVFLYSDNVPVEDEVKLKRKAAERGLLVMGPDCGTAIVDGIGLGFANRVRRGNIGLVAASGTGLQAATVAIHRAGGGVSQALGTGGRDLSEAVGAISARQALAQLAADPETDVIVLISKPPSPAVADALLNEAKASGKPVVVNFIGYDPSERRGDESSVFFARTLDEAGERAAAVGTEAAGTEDGGRKTEGDDRRPTTDDRSGAPESHASRITHHASPETQFAIRNSQLFLRALYSGGTLAYEALFLLQDYLETVYSNAPLKGGPALENLHESRGHTIVDLGEDVFTVGRLHPMMDNDLRIRRLREEAADPETGLILLDVVLGDGAHPDPASELAPAIADAIATAKDAGRALPIVAVVVGTDLDPQDLNAQIEQLTKAGAVVFTRHDEAVAAVGEALTTDDRRPTTDYASPNTHHASSPDTQFAIRNSQFSAINIGVETFTDSLSAQGASVVHVDWRPPAGGNAKLMGILARMKAGQSTTDDRPQLVDDRRPDHFS